MLVWTDKMWSPSFLRPLSLRSQEPEGDTQNAEGRKPNRHRTL